MKIKDKTYFYSDSQRYAEYFIHMYMCLFEIDHTICPQFHRIFVFESMQVRKGVAILAFFPMIL